MIQDKLIQIKVSSKFKRMLMKLAETRGLPLSTYIKFVLTEKLQVDPIWNQLESEESKRKEIDEFTEELSKVKKTKRKK